MPKAAPPIKRFHLYIRKDLVITKLARSLDDAVRQLPPTLRAQWETNGRRSSSSEWMMRVV